MELLGVFHARRLRAHELAIRLGWDRVHPALGMTKPFYERFIPSITARDFRLAGTATWNGRWTSSRSAMPDRSVGDLAVVLHSHMPYVEGFGTFPFGEEWLFDAWAGSWLPVLATADRATVTVTPVLADQLEAGGVGERMLAFLRRHRLEAARDAADAAGARAEGIGAGGGRDGEAEQFATAVGRLEALDEGPLSVFREAQEEGRVELMASAATHAVLPKLATIEGRRLQIDVGLRSHRRRFGRARGFWLPECAYAPGLEALLAERDLSHTCLDQSAVEDELTALAPARLRGGPVAFTIDWPAVSLVWSADGYPSHPAYLDYHRLSANGIRLWAISGDPYDPAKARRTAGEHAAEFARAVAKRLSRYAGERGRRGLCVFAVDTELLGHWWAEGPAWLAELPAAAERAGVRLVRLSEALERHEATERARCRQAGERARAWRPGTRRRSPTSPGARGGWSSACCGPSAAIARAPAGGARGARAARGAVERLGLHGPPRAGGRLPVSARHRPRPRAPGGP